MKLFGIKFYNPFKPHIVVDAFGIYRVRKYELFFGWEYYDGNGYYFHNKTYANFYFSLDSAKEILEEAQASLILEKERSKKKAPDKVVHEG